MTLPHRYRFGPYTLDVLAGRLSRGGEVLAVRQRPLALLMVLVERPGVLLTKDDLLSLAWPGVVVEENNLQVQVSVLRKLIGADAIATVPGAGYRFDLPVQRERGGTSATRAAAADADLLGREAELAHVVQRVRRERLVTLTGPGGIGKTRLARAVVQALELADDKATTAWVDLSALGDPSLLAPCVAEAVFGTVRAGAEGGTDALAALLQRLSASSTLLVLDNAEHLLDALSPFVAMLLERTRDVHVLVTSQAPLRLSVEHQVRLAPLSLPPSNAGVAEAAATGAVALFMRRAAAHGPSIVLDEQTLPHVSAICRRLDGLPLALELAAARVPAFGLSGVASLLDERFRLLSAGVRDAPARQQTLAAVYDWTFGLLNGHEQAVFRRLAVLAEPLTLHDAASLLAQPGNEWALYDALASLVERSLLQLDDGDPPRYSLLESTRAYAMARLRSAGEHAFIAHASAWYERRGDEAAHGASGLRALSTYGTALDLALALPAGTERDEREFQLGLKLGPAVQATLGPAHPRCEALYRRSVELARRHPASAQAFQAVWGYWHFLSLAGRDRDAAPYAREIVEMAPQLGDDGLQLEAWHAAMTTSDLLGDAPSVVAHARRIAGLYDSCRHHRLTFAFGGHDPGVCALGQGAVNLWLTDQPDEARAMARRALDLAATLQHGYSRATAAFYASITYAALGAAGELRRTADALVQLSDQFGMEMLLTEGRFFQGCARHADGERAGVAQMRDALARIERTHDLAFVFVYMAFLADALLRERAFDEIDTLVERALGYAALGQGLFLPELLRLRALSRRERSDARWRDDAEEAMRIAAQQGAAVLHRRAASLIATQAHA